MSAKRPAMKLSERLGRWLLGPAVVPFDQPVPGRYYSVPKSARFVVQDPMPLLRCLRTRISKKRAPVILSILIQLRGRELSPDEFWWKWGRISRGVGPALEPLRQVVECYLETRELPGQRSFPNAWPVEDPRRSAFRGMVDAAIRILKERSQSDEVIPSGGPDGRGDEPAAP